MFALIILIIKNFYKVLAVILSQAILIMKIVKSVKTYLWMKIDWSVVLSLPVYFRIVMFSFFYLLSSSAEGGRRVSYRGLRKLRPLAETPFHPPGIPPKDRLRGTVLPNGTQINDLKIDRVMQ